MLTNKSNTVLYTGVTNDLQRRIKEHKNEEIEGFTKRYHLHKLVFFEEFSNINDAIKNEKRLKRWTRAKKNVLIESRNPNWVDLSQSEYKV